MTSGTVPSAVVKRSERARKAGWASQITIRARNGKWSVVHWLQGSGLRARTMHLDGKAVWCYVQDAETNHVTRISFKELDSLLKVTPE